MSQAGRLEGAGEARDSLVQILCPMLSSQHDALGERLETDLVAARAGAYAAHEKHRRAQQRRHDEGTGREAGVAAEKRHDDVTIAGHGAIPEDADDLATLDRLARAQHAVRFTQQDDRLGQSRVQPVQERDHSRGVATVHQWPHRHG